MSFGVAITVRAGLGTTTISSIPVVLAAATQWSVGTFTIILNSLLVLAQIPILRKQFKARFLWQLPLGIVFGMLCDFSLWLTSWIEVNNYLFAWLLVVMSSLLVSFGIFMQLLAQVAVLAGEGFVQALNTVIPRLDFGSIKQIVDWSMVLIAAGISWFSMHDFIGVREGTIFAAIFLGLFVRMWQKLYLKTLA